MNLWVFCLLHNEAPLLPYFMRHYQTIADRIVLYDDHSTDGTPQLAAAYAKVSVRTYPGAGLDDSEFVDFAAFAYREARDKADWAMWVDADEFIYHPDLRERLEHYQAEGVTLPHVAGYAMFANDFPSTDGQIYDAVRVGVRYTAYDKPVVFSPNLELRWIAGKHTLASDGGANRGGEAELKLLHFRHLGERYFAERNARNYARMTVRNIALNHGFQTYPENQAALGWAAQVRAMELEMRVVL